MRGGLAALATALLGGVVASEYVDAALFSLVTPALVGIACGATAMAAAGVRAHRPEDRGVHRRIRLLAAGLAVLGTAYGFRLVPGASSAFTPVGTVLPPYLAAAAGAWVWTMPPRQRARGARRK